jgi:hypothetical protein
MVAVRSNPLSEGCSEGRRLLPMRRILLGIGLSALLVVLGVSVAYATHSSGKGPNQDLVSGTGHARFSEEFDIDVHVNAKSGPSGEDPQGHFFFTGVSSFGSADIRGDVTCLNVVGNRATIGGEITQSRVDNPSFEEGEGVLIFVEDNGEPGKANDMLELFAEPTPPTVCPPPEPDFAITGGNYIVHDAMP